MKIRLDNNLSPRVCEAVAAALPNRDGYEVSHYGTTHPPGTSDPDWLRAFAADGGTAIVSGDARILQNWPDLVAYTETGLISFFPPHPFEKLDRFGKVAYIVRWWPAIIEKIKIGQPGDRWRLPFNWERQHTSMQLLVDPRVKGRKVDSTLPSNVVKISKKRATDGAP